MSGGNYVKNAAFRKLYKTKGLNPGGFGIIIQTLMFGERASRELPVTGVISSVRRITGVAL